MKMKKILAALVLFLSFTCALRAQDDSLNVQLVDSTLVGRSIMSVMGSGVRIVQSQSVQQALTRYISNNSSKDISGYRIRVYFDNGQSARAQSEAVAQNVRSMYPEIGVYRSFESPNYKVTVGDFRSKDEALRVYNALKPIYPTAFIIRESINYPR